MENKKILIVRKVDIQEFMEALNELYHMGIDYVDMYGEIGEKGDSIYMSFSKEYMSEEFKEEFDNVLNQANDIPNVDTKLSEDDINQIT